MKKLISIISISLLTLICSSFITTNSIKNQTNKSESSNKLLFVNDKISIKTNLVEYKVPNRSVVKKYILLTIENKTNKKIRLNFTKEAYYNGKCPSCNTAESNFTITLNKKETIKGNCDSKSKALKVFHSFVTNESDTKLTDLKITNVTITKI